jgi:hypothetical protein
MSTNDTCCSIVPYFNVADGKLDNFKEICEQFVAQTEKEDKVLYYGFAFSGSEAHCREGYADAEGLLAHLDNIGEILGKALEISEISRLEVHGPAAELEKLKGPLKDLNPQYFELEYGFRR